MLGMTKNVDPMERTNPQSRERDIARRTLVLATAWSTPAVVVLAASPARAASGDLNVEVGDAPFAALVRCQSIEDITVTVRDGNGLPVSGVTIAASLTSGLFATGGLSAVTQENGQAVITGIRVDGDAQRTGESITVVALYNGDPISDPAIIPLTVATGAVRGIVYDSEDNDGDGLLEFDASFAPFFGAESVSSSATITFATAADQTIYYWGDASDAANIDTRQQVIHLGDPVGPVQAASAWSTPRTRTSVPADAWSYGLIVTEDGTLYSINSSNGSAPTVRATRSTTTLGTILDIQVVEGAAYVLTDQGVYRTTALLPGTPAAFDINALVLVGNTSDAAGIHPVSGIHSTPSSTTGGLVQTGVWVFNDSNEATFVDASVGSAPTYQSLGLAPGETIKTVHPSFNGALVFTSQGRILAHGSAWNLATKAYAEHATWTVVATGVSVFDTWVIGTAQWFGGAYATNDGTVFVFNTAGPNAGWGASTTWFYDLRPQGAVAVSQVLASDGNYAIITEEGHFWVWAGNADWPAAGFPIKDPLRLENDGSPANVIGASIWAFNGGNGAADSRFLGGGAVITDAPMACSWPQP